MRKYTMKEPAFFCCIIFFFFWGVFYGKKLSHGTAYLLFSSKIKLNKITTTHELNMVLKSYSELSFFIGKKL